MSQNGVHGFWIQGGEIFEAAGIESDNKAETLTSSVTSASSATGYAVYTRKPASDSGSEAVVRKYSFSIEGIQQGEPQVLEGIDLIQAELQLRQDLNNDDVTGITIEGNNPLGNEGPWNMPGGHSTRVYNTNSKYLLISTKTGLTSEDLKSSTSSDTHALLTTNGEDNYVTGENKTFVAAFTIDSDGNAINKTSTPVNGFELILRDADNTVNQISFDREGVLKEEKELTNEVINLEMSLIMTLTAITSLDSSLV